MNGKTVVIFSLLFAIVLKCALAYYFFQFETDKSFQAIAAKSIVQGKGLTIPQVHANDLSIVHYEPLVGWPPGYTLFVTPVYALLNDLQTACLMVDLFFIISFFILLAALLKELNFPSWLTAVLLLFNGATISDNIFLSTPSDLPAVVFAVLACFMAVKLYQKNNISKPAILLLAIINFIPALLRFMYVPVVFMIPFFFFWIGMKENDFIKKRAGLWLLAITGLFFIFLFLFLHSKTATVFYSAAAPTHT
ncbi:MAG TPA: hypothetical protein VM012_04670, partial [Flavitalea sp.]|nr:hypothetical protein [Flavitalea sp.]